MCINKEILLLLFCTINLSWAEVFHNIIKYEDPCITKCKEAPLTLINKISKLDGKYVTECCQRGCRFFNIVDLQHKLRLNNFNKSLDACDSSCTEAYIVLQDLMACKIGCVFMSSHPVSELSFFSVALNNNNKVRPKLLSIPFDIPENDIVNDSGLGRELISEWWNSDGFKLPETFFKTIPLDSGTVDYSISSEYLGETEKPASIPGSDWLQCASRHTGIPRWLLTFGIVAAALSALWLCLSPEKSVESIEKISLVKPNSPSKVTIYVPDEAPLQKTPPPKYSNANMNDPKL